MNGFLEKSIKEKAERERRYNILYVDDEDANLRIFKHAFSREYNIYLAKSGADALVIIKKESIHLIVTDQMMPRMTGVQLLKEVCKVNPQIIRMILTGFSDIGVIIQAVNEIGIHRYLKKPWDRNELNAIFKEALTNHLTDQAEMGPDEVREMAPKNESSEKEVSDVGAPKKVPLDLALEPLGAENLEFYAQKIISRKVERISAPQYDYFKLRYLLDREKSYNRAKASFTIVGYALKSTKGLLIVSGFKNSKLVSFNLEISKARLLIKRVERLVKMKARKGFRKLQVFNDRLTVEIGYSSEMQMNGDMDTENYQPDQIIFWIDDLRKVELSPEQWTYVVENFKKAI